MTDFIKTDAYCLKIKPVRNKSAVLLFFTKELGVLSIFQKGFFSSKSRLNAIIDIGQEVSLVLKQHQNSLFLHEASLIASYSTPDYSILTLSSFIFELLASLPQSIPLNSQYLYSLLHSLLPKIVNSSGKFNLILNFEVKLLSLLGLTGDLDMCSNCHQLFIENMKCFSAIGELNFICLSCLNRTLKYNEFLANEREVLLSWLNCSELNQTSHLGKNSIFKLQTHLNTIFNHMLTLKTLDPFMKIMYGEASNLKKSNS